MVFSRASLWLIREMGDVLLMLQMCLPTYGSQSPVELNYMETDQTANRRGEGLSIHMQPSALLS